jgi:ATP-dependent Zn protease
MRVLCGGRIAEQRATGDVWLRRRHGHPQVTSSPASHDPRMGHERQARLRPLRRQRHPRDLRPRSRTTPTTPPRLIDEEVRRLVDEAYADADKRILSDNWEKVVAVAEALLKHDAVAEAATS